MAGLKTWLVSVGVKVSGRPKKEELVKRALEKLGYSTAAHGETSEQ